MKTVLRLLATFSTSRIDMGARCDALEARVCELEAQVAELNDNDAEFLERPRWAEPALDLTDDEFDRRFDDFLRIDRWSDG